MRMTLGVGTMEEVISAWDRGLRALERGGASDEEHAAFHEYALQAGLQSPEDYLEVRSSSSPQPSN